MNTSDLAPALACELGDDHCACARVCGTLDDCQFAYWRRPTPALVACGADEIFPAAYISDGPELARAFAALGFAPPKPRRPIADIIGSALVWTLIGAGLLAMITGALDAGMQALDRIGAAL